MRRQQRSCASLVLALAGGCAAWAQGLQLTVDATRPGAAISPLLHGIYFEELNHAGEGGLYAEMVQNRTFEEQTTAGWSLRAHPGATGRMSLDTSHPLNAANHTAL